LVIGGNSTNFLFWGLGTEQATIDRPLSRRTGFSAPDFYPDDNWYSGSSHDHRRKWHPPRLSWSRVSAYWGLCKSP